MKQNRVVETRLSLRFDNQICRHPLCLYILCMNKNNKTYIAELNFKVDYHFSLSMIF